MTEKVKCFEDLDCWKACREVRNCVAKQICPSLPKDEKYRLYDQILRASRSSTANIAEGYGRFHYLDNAKFCSNSRGSLYEVLDHLITAKDEQLISAELYDYARSLAESAIRLVNGYISYLQRAAK